MPSLKSSTKGGDSISLFATERRALKSAMSTLYWLAGKSSQAETKEHCEDTVKAIGDVLTMYPEPEKSAKPTEAVAKK